MKNVAVVVEINAEIENLVVDIKKGKLWKIMIGETIIDLDTLLEIRSGLVAFAPAATANTIEIVDELIKDIQRRQKTSWLFLFPWYTIPMSERIPQVKTYQITVVETGERYRIDAPTNRFARVNFFSTHPEYWGKKIKVGVLRGGG